MTILRSEGAGDPDLGFYAGVATQSLRLDGGAEITLDNAGAATSNKIATISTWFKRADETTVLAYLFHSKNDGSFGDGSNGLASFSITLDADDNISVVQYNGNPSFNANQYDFGVKTSGRKFRDLGSWYHLVVAIDTTQGSGTTNEADRIKMYINGDQQTVVAINDGSGYQDFADENQLIAVNQDGEQRWGGSVDDSIYAHVYLAETNVVDGLALDASYFGETKNGVWIAKAPNVSEYGNHGYRLQYKETSVGSGSSSTIGADTSGKNNHFTSTNVVAQDCAIPDSPENNMCTLNPIGRRYGQSYVGTFSEGSLKIASGGNATNIFGTMAINQIASEGGVYFELRIDGDDGSGARTYFGVIGDTGTNNKNVSSNAGGYTFPIKGMLSSTPRGYFTTDTDSSGSIDLTANTAFGVGDVAGIAILSDGKFFVHRNGTYLNDASGNTGNPSTGANPIATIDLTEGDWFPYLGYASSYTANFGQDGTFNGNETPAGTYTDANGIGLFNYAVPTNCLALCTSNMAKPTIGPNSATQADDHFNTITYIANGSASRAITGVGFQPDWLWVKSRSASYYHGLWDSSRTNKAALYSNATDAEDTSTAGTLGSLDADGFTTPNVSGGGFINIGSTTYVAWNWKANGGTTSSNSNGSIASTVQANTTAGFSIVTYTSNGGDHTVGHGLGVAPKMIWLKDRDDVGSWYVYNENNGANKYQKLNDSIAATTQTSVWQNTAPTTTVFSVGGSVLGLANNTKCIAYCFAEVEGYSKIGSYTGNGSTDGTFIYLGFRPAFIIYKRTDSTGNWLIDDNKTQTFNPDSNYLVADTADLEGDTTTNTAGHVFDMLSNGFKMRNTNSARNADGGTFIYMAFASIPFKFANAR